MYETQVTITGNVVNDPRHTVTENGTMITNFRMVSQERRYNRELSAWEDGETTFVNVSCFKTLAAHVSASVAKGDPVIVHGKLRVRQWENQDRRGTSVEISAFAVGHDLCHGAAKFTRSARGPRQVEETDPWTVTELDQPEGAPEFSASFDALSAPEAGSSVEAQAA